jgi:murein DD-endopeptidase MepM/ murein hydrolase activator NlpD
LTKENTVLASNHRTRLVFLSLYILLSGILFVGNQPGAAQSRTDNAETAKNGDQASYRNSLLGFEIQYPENWKLQESLSMGYPYITIIDRVALARLPEATELEQGALIEISAEEYRLPLPIGDYLKSFVPFNVSSEEAFGEALSSIESEHTISYAWGIEGISVRVADNGLLYDNHAALIGYAQNKLLLQIRLTVTRATSEQEQAYLESFNQILESLHFSPPSAMPQPVVWSAEAPADPLQIDLEGTAANQFLTLPFDYHYGMGVAQGWIYSWGGAHLGVDYIRGNVNSPSGWRTFDVVAAADGVACMNCVYGPGNKVWIKHTLGNTVYYTYYGHLATIDPSIQSATWAVTRGQKIGTAGNTGTTYTHLHFGVYNAAWVEVDPYALYTTRSLYYPNPTYRRMGVDHLFTHDPPLYPAQAKPNLTIMKYLPIVLR